MSGTITVEQTWSSGQFDKNQRDRRSSTATINYLVRGVTTEEDAVAAVETFLGGTAASPWQGIPYSSASVDERMTEDIWKVAVKYKADKKEPEDANETQFSFDISSGHRRVVMSLGQKAKLPSTVADSKGINDGEGIDVITPVCTLSETHLFSPSTITTAWKKTIASMVGCINSTTYQGFAAGELLFSGCSGARNGDNSDDKWQITFRFMVQMSQDNIQIGDLGTISKRGWDVLWIRYDEDTIVANNKKKVQRIPKAAYVEQVYPEVDFATLGI